MTAECMGSGYCDGDDHAPRCPFSPDDAPECCGDITTWDDTSAGTTCGGLSVGAFVCAKCGHAFIGKRTRAHETWKLAGGGRSIDVGATRLRAEKCADPKALFARIVRLPDLENALRAIADGAPNARELAVAALEGGAA